MSTGKLDFEELVLNTERIAEQLERVANSLMYLDQLLVEISREKN